jgi:hypothetical protein
MAARRDTGRITLARHHNLTAYGRVFKRHRRVHIPEFLTQESASSLHDACARGEQPVPKFVSDFFTDPDFLFFVRSVCGNSGIRVIDAKAIRQSSAKLTPAESYAFPKTAVAGFEISLTKAWRADWGGVMVFLDETGNVTEGYAPAFNSLNLFAPSQPFLITQVATYAGGQRLSIVGSLA